MALGTTLTIRLLERSVYVHVCAKVDAAGECGSLKYVNNYCRNRHRSTNVLRIDVVYEREILYMYMRDTD